MLSTGGTVKKILEEVLAALALGALAALALAALHLERVSL